MPCKQGIRKNIEEAKKYYAEQRKYNPMRELWVSLVKRVHHEDSGFEGLSIDEKIYFAVGVLDGEVYNGGMHQYFWNSSASYYRFAVDGLLELNALNSLRLLSDAQKILFPKGVPEDCDDRRAAIKEYPEDGTMPDWALRLDQIDKEYCSDPDGLSERFEAFARSRRLVQPFETN